MDPLLLLSVLLRSLFGGRSEGKLILFALWLFSGFIASKSKFKVKRDKELFVLLSISLLAYSLFLHLSLASSYGLSPSSFLASQIYREGHFEYEGTFSGHVHVLKPSLCYISQALGIKISSYDSGCPLTLVLSFEQVLPAMLLSMVLFILFLSMVSGKGFLELFFLSLSTYIVFVACLDGGPFSTTGENAIAALAFILALESKPLTVLLAPLLSSLLFLKVVSPFHVPTFCGVAVFTLAPAYVLLRDGLKGRIGAFSLFLLFLSFPFLMKSTAFRETFTTVKGRILIYGLPEGMGQRELSRILPCGNVIEKHGWLAVVELDCEMEKWKLEKVLREKSNTETYLYVIPSGKPRVYRVRGLTCEFPRESSIYRFIDQDHVLSNFDFEALALYALSKSFKPEGCVVAVDPWWLS